MSKSEQFFQGERQDQGGGNAGWALDLRVRTKKALRSPKDKSIKNEIYEKGESSRTRATDCDPATRNPKEGEGAEQ